MRRAVKCAALESHLSAVHQYATCEWLLWAHIAMRNKRSLRNRFACF